ncbi:MAG: ketohydroxyglutarate aldolase [Planctomycetota bacterium]|nr:ketohydroxyglutarate aldolase [Planctomycetota bacterium]
MTTKPRDRVIVTIDDAHAKTIQAVAAELQLAGLQVSSVLSVSGIITGEVSAEKRAGLSQIKGVVDVEPDGEMQAI